ncbi:MAG: cobyrinate a,c-diamide synthase [Cyanobacteria bacterium P01_A01_bin.84]
MALIIAGERSGVGKTTVTLTLLSFLVKHLVKEKFKYVVQQKHSVQSFKVGPDYIDPMFHEYVTGTPCRNLDPVLTSDAYIQECFNFYTQTQDVNYALVEGVMGLFDGVSFIQSNLNQLNQLNRKTSGNCTQLIDKTINQTIHQIHKTKIHNPLFENTYASTAHIAKLLNLPILLVIDCSRLSGSVAAIARGYSLFDPELNIAGVVLNRVGSDRHLKLLENSLSTLQIPILGVMRKQDNITIPDRHLGLVPTVEIAELDDLIERFADVGESCFDWEKLLPLVEIKSIISSEKNKKNQSGLKKQEIFLPSFPDNSHSPIRIAIARDKAFNFYYQDNFDLLIKLGAELVFWSPLVDKQLPPNIAGIYLGGGFPEVFAEKLSQNTEILKAVKKAILSGIPTIAECGGLMYLCEEIINFRGKSWEMVGIIPAKTIMDKRLSLGYRRAIALQDTPLVTAGTTVYGHEFHRSCLSLVAEKPLFESFRVDEEESIGNEGWFSLANVHASYIHLHWGANSEIPQRFLQQCRMWKVKKER